MPKESESWKGERMRTKTQSCTVKFIVMCPKVWKFYNLKVYPTSLNPADNQLKKKSRNLVRFCSSLVANSETRDNTFLSQQINTS
jgi:hypothetical protein